MNNPESKFSPSRRTLLGILAGGAGLTASATAKSALAIPRLGNKSGTEGAPATWVLDAVETANSFGDGATIPFFQYQAIGGGQTRGSLPYAEATEGVSMTVTVTNSLAISIRPAVIGVARGPWIRPGQTAYLRVTNTSFQWARVRLGGHAFQVVASDGYPMAQAYTTNEIELGPGERYDLLLQGFPVGDFPGRVDYLDGTGGVIGTVKTRIVVT